MDTKYSNIFWHQGIKIFEDELSNTKNGRILIDGILSNPPFGRFDHSAD